MSLVTIVSHMARQHPDHYPTDTWTGDVQFAEPRSDGHPTDRAEQAFRLFNRVEEADAERLEYLGYRLPSMSVGDTVTIDGETWLCENCGFSRAT